MQVKQDDRRSKLVYIGWWLVLALLCYGLLSPDPPKLGTGFLPDYLKFYASKGVHLGGFTFLAMGAGLLAITPRHQRLLWGLLVVFAALTEYLQTFVEGRFGCVADVFINLTGVTLGVGLALGWRLRSAARARRSLSATTTAT